MGLVYVYPAKTFNCVSPHVQRPITEVSHPVTRLLPVFKLRNPKPANGSAKVPHWPKVNSMKSSYSWKNPATSKKPWNAPTFKPCLNPASMLMAVSGRSPALGYTCKGPSPVRMNFSAMVGKRKPCPTLARNHVASAAWKLSPALNTGLAAVESLIEKCSYLVPTLKFRRSPNF